MALIINPIPEQNFERIRKRIGEILATEILEQANLTGEALFSQTTVWEERFTSFENAEMPAVNVSFTNADNLQHNQRSERYDFTYHIDVYVTAKANATQYGDLSSQQKLQRILGLIRAIFRDTHYKRLAFVDQFIMSHRSSDITIAQPNIKDGDFLSVGRITHIVTAEENNGIEHTRTADGYDTKIKLEETDKGFQYITNN